MNLLAIPGLVLVAALILPRLRPGLAATTSGSPSAGSGR
jgi:hypothetical protein